MKRIIATFAIVIGMFGASAAIAPSASACSYVECSAIFAQKLTRVLF